MAFPSSIAGSILEKLGSYAYQQIVAAWGFTDELNKLKETLEDIQAVLSDAEEKQEKRTDVGNWLERLKDVLHNVKDVLDEFEIQDQLRQMANRGTTGSSGQTQSNKLRNLILSTSSIALRFKLSQKIRTIWKRLKEIHESRKQFSLDEKPEKGRPEQKKRDTHALVDVPTVIGRDDDKEKIFELLMGLEDLAVISIVGLGGLGKTALAKLVYNDERVIKQFPLRLWVCVSEDFEVKTLAKEILISAKVVPSDDWNLQRLQTELQDTLQERKFLLVLDDVWNEDPGKWENLRELLPGGAGSKIIATTRSKSVASIMSSQNEYELSELSHDICLSLFLRYAGIKAEDKQHQNLVEIGKVIVKKCGGNPLAAKTLGSMLSKKTEEDWLHVRDSEIWELKTPGEDDIMPALKLSYNHMPTYLKPCFAYCAVFPKAFKFNSVDLIQLWSANGLIPSDGNQVEQVGMQLLKELFARCFFEDIEEFVFIHSFKMHDLVHDLARLVASEFLMLGSKTIGNLKKVRHLSLFADGLFDQTIQKLPQLEKNLRTIVCPITLSEPINESNIGRFILSCKYLWVLDLSSSSFEELPSSIGHLKHLRYFSLSGNRRIRKLPASICKLVKLQALGLGGCKKLEKLPKGVSNLVNLRLLELTTKEEHLQKQEIGCLGSLQVLFISRCHFLKSLFDDISNLTSLRSLSIVDCHQLLRLPCSVNHLTALENLLISNCGALDLTMKEENDSSETLSNLRSITMTKLRRLSTLPEWLQNSAGTLRCLIIEDCLGFTNLPVWLQSFSSLQKLHITGCPRFPAMPEAMKFKIAHVPDVYVDSMRY